MRGPGDSSQPFTAARDNGEQAFTGLMQQAHLAVAQVDADSRVSRVNQRMAELFGYDRDELLGMTIGMITHPDSARISADMLARLLDGAPSVSYDKKFLRKNGSVFWGNTTVSVLREPNGQVRGFIGVITDLTLQRHAQHLLQCQNEALELIVDGAEPKEVFRRLIAFVEAESEGDAVASVLLLRDGRLYHGAAPSLPAEYNSAIEGIAAEPFVGTCAAAAARSEVVITPDLATSPEWHGLRHLPLELGLRAAWSMPIVAADGRVLGTFGTYFRRPRQPTALERETVAMFTKTAALAIARHHGAEQLVSVNREADRQRRLYEAVADTTPDLIYVFDRQHRFTYANRALLAMWGKTREESLGHNCLELGYEPWHAAMHDREIDEVVATKRAVRGVVPFNGTNGRRLYDYIFAPVIGADGEVEAVAGTTRDVTEQRQAAAAVKFLADLTQSLSVITDPQEIIHHTVGAVGRHFEAHRCYFVECRESENLIRVSENWRRDESASLEGTYNLFDFGGIEWWRQYAKGDFSVADAREHPLIEPTIAKNYAEIGVVSYAVQPVKRIGEWTVVLAVTENRPRHWTEDEIRLLENVAARVWPLVERARSEAALRAARDEALAASRAKDNFLAALSHELRTPLNPALLLASEAAGDESLPERARTDFATIAHHVSVEARLIDDLLDLTRITHQKMSLSRSLLDLHLLLQRVTATFAEEVASRKLELVTRWDADAAMVHADEVRLQQIFWNLLRNALKFTPAGGRVTVATAIDAALPDRVRIEISDTGIGLTADELAKVFDLFAQGDHANDSSKTPYGGLGLGLTIARRLAELHDGTITAYSAGRGLGSMFAVELPLATQVSPAAAAETRPTPTSEQRIQTGSLRRVLLVEDHEPSRRVLARLLASRQIEVVPAANATEALERAGEQSFDLVISDLGLPDLSGYELMTTLQAKYSFPGIALSGYGTEADIARSRSAGFRAHLTKPVQAAALDRVLREMGGT